MTLDPSGPELSTFARAILVAHQHDALDYLDMRAAQMAKGPSEDDATFWSAVRAEARRQVEVGEWQPHG